MDLFLDFSELPFLLLFDLFEENRSPCLLYGLDFQNVTVLALFSNSILPPLFLSHVVHRLEGSVGLLKILRLARVEAPCLNRSCCIFLSWLPLWAIRLFFFG